MWIPSWSGENWGIVGDFNGWTNDVKFTYNKLTKFYEATLSLTDATDVKFRKDGAWTTEKGSPGGDKLTSDGGNIHIPQGGNYLVRVSLNFDGYGDRYYITTIH